MPNQTITVTRTFGLKPLDDQRICFDDVFGQALSLGNLFIQAGLPLDDDQFSGKGKESVKRFYDAVREDPRVAAWLDGTHLRERACRCVAQNAYFAMRGHVERKRMLSIVASILLSSTVGPAFPLFARSFPSPLLVSTTREKLASSGMNRASLSSAFIKNTICQARNIIRAAMMQEHGKDIAALLDLIENPAASFIDPSVIAIEIHASLEFLARRFMKVFSNKLTRCFKQLARHHGKGARAGQPPRYEPGTLEALVLRIYHGDPATTKQGQVAPGKPLQFGTWKRQRKSWRDRRLEGLLKWIESSISCKDVETAVLEAISTTSSSLTVERVLSCLFKPRKQKLPRCRVPSATPSSFVEWLERLVERRVEQSIVDAIAKHVAPWANALLHELETNPGQWMRRPVIRGRAIPLGQDDSQVYRLNMVPASEPPDDPNDVPNDVSSVFVTLSFYSGRRVAKATGASKARVDLVKEGKFSLDPVTFQIHPRDVDRFQAMLDGGFVPKQPTISLRRGGKLVLGIPFDAVPVVDDSGKASNKLDDEIEQIVTRTIDEWITRDEKDALGPTIKDGWNHLDERWTPPAKRQSNKAIDRIVKLLRSIVHSGIVVACAGDLGLKTDVAVSIVRALRLVDGTYCLANIHRREEARYFLTQQQLRGNRLEWLFPGFDPRVHEWQGNLKRELHHLIKAIPHLQSTIDAFKNRHPSDFNWHPCFHEMHDEMDNKWQKVRNIHGELARQFATRLVAICEYHDVDVLRLENLSWSRHSRKQDVGYYLKTNQVHWFFSKVQENATCLAHQAGIDVELVNAR